MILLRWEFVELFEPWAAPQSNLLGAPIASGCIERDEQNRDDAFYAPCDAIVAPASEVSAHHLILAVEVFGSYTWLVTMGCGGQAPVAPDGHIHPVDPVPHIVVPASGMQGGGRSRDVRAVRPGTRILAQVARS